MLELLGQINGIGWYTIATSIVVVVLGVPKAAKAWKDFKDSTGLVSQKSIKERQLEERLQRMEKRIVEVDKRVTDTSNMYENRLTGYHGQSIDIRNGIFDTLSTFNNKVDALSSSIQGLANDVHNMQEKNDSSDRSRIKDRIAQAYRHYHEKKEWTNMEKEAFNDLIRSYEDAGGINSFVHTTCEPESLTWIVIDED